MGSNEIIILWNRAGLLEEITTLHEVAGKALRREIAKGVKSNSFPSNPWVSINSIILSFVYGVRTNKKSSSSDI